MLEGIMVVASEPASRPRATPRIGAAMREARTCYDHLAGRLAVALADALIARGAIQLSDDAGVVTPTGHELLATFGAPLAAVSRGRVFCRPCLDWSERRPHLAGAVGAALCRRCLELGWIHRGRASRVVDITSVGRRGFAERFGIAC